jgi:alpha-tubulin suppressor-like RCC1 family protein
VRGFVVVLALAGCDVMFGLHRDPPKPDAPTPVERWASADGGNLHTCGIRLDHTLWCWGRNDSGQLGARANAGDLEADEPRQVGSDADWERVAAGHDSTCAITIDHRLYCWGDNTFGQIATGTVVDTVDTPHLIAGMWSAVAIGQRHACAIDVAGALSCWGSNDYAQLGIGSTGAAQTAPVLVAGGLGWISVDVGGLSACGVTTDHGLYCWGYNGVGQLGLGSVLTQSVPARVGTDEYQKVAAGEYFTCGLETSGKLRCWGRNDLGQVGDATGVHRATPVPVGQDAITDWSDVVAGKDHACARHGGDQVLCWGSNDHGQLVGQTLPLRTEPAAIAGEWKTIAMGDRTTCLIDRERQLSCAGYGPAGGLGTGVGSKRSPIQIAGTWNEVAAGRALTCARSGLVLSCWGTNAHRAVGDGTPYDRSTPTALAGTWTSVAVFDHVCAIDSTVRMSCWGANGLGQLGVGDVADRDRPVQINTSTWSSVTATFHTCALDFGGLMTCWGSNAYGEIGQTPNSPPYSPTPMSTGNATWFAVVAGDYHTCAISSARTVSCWGYNGEGELGPGAPSITHVAQPVALSGAGPVDALTAGERHVCARAGTSVWCWGGNTEGQLGNQTIVSTPVPFKVDGAWQAISAGQRHTCGIQIDGSLWCWGDNAWGQLGDGTLFERHLPTRVGTESDWIAVSAGDDHTCARTVNNTLWCWGSNQLGELGDGSAWRSELEQITR